MAWMELHKPDKDLDGLGSDELDKLDSLEELNGLQDFDRSDGIKTDGIKRQTALRLSPLCHSMSLICVQVRQ